MYRILANEDEIFISNCLLKYTNIPLELWYIIYEMKYELEYNMWKDNYLALELRENLIESKKYNNMLGPDEKLNDYFILLTQQYSDEISINIKLLDEISISSIDMITYKSKVPYRLVVPMFPIITDHHQFDFGKEITSELE